MDARFFFVFFIDFRQMSSYIFYKKIYYPSVFI